MVRIDFIFSYWIFFWYLFYLAGFVKYNPKFAIICALVENIFTMLLMIYYKTKKKLLLLFFIMFILMKVIPLFSIWTTKIKLDDIVFTMLLFSLYLIWTKKGFFYFKRQKLDLILHNKNSLPGMTFLDKII